LKGFDFVYGKTCEQIDRKKMWILGTRQKHNQIIIEKKKEKKKKRGR